MNNMKPIKDNLDEAIERFESKQPKQYKTIEVKGETYFVVEFPNLKRYCKVDGMEYEATLVVKSIRMFESVMSKIKNNFAPNEKISDVLNGAGFTVEYLDNDTCPHCKGSGSQITFDFDGMRRISSTVFLLPPNDAKRIVCPFCNGSGKFTEIPREDSPIEDNRLSGYETKTEWQRIIKTKALLFLDNIKAGKKPWFYISGQVGSGKTKIITEIAKELNTGISSVFGSTNEYGLKRGVVIIDYLTELSSTKAIANTPEYNNRINELKAAEVLVIDDAFKVSKTDADMKVMNMIIKHRDEQALITIFSSEANIEHVKGLDESTGSRIEGLCAEHLIHLPKDELKNQRINKES